MQVFATFGLSILLQSIAVMVFGTRYVALDDPVASSRVNILGAVSYTHLDVYKRQG